VKPVKEAEAVVDGGNHRQVQVIQPVKVSLPKAASPSSPFDPKYTRQVTQWLITNGKTPFDVDINPAIIAQETRIDLDTVRNILTRMRHTKTVRE